MLYDNEKTRTIVYLPTHTAETIDIPETVKTIGTYSFKNCPLTTVTIPDTVETIAAYAFGNSANLKTVHFGKNVTAKLIVGTGNAVFTQANLPRVGNELVGDLLRAVGALIRIKSEVNIQLVVCSLKADHVCDLAHKAAVQYALDAIDFFHGACPLFLCVQV